MNDMHKIKALLTELEGLKTDNYGKDFLLTWENSQDNLKAVMAVAEILQLLHREKKPWRVFDYGLAISIFRDNSTRTRFSFASAVNGLGLALSELDEVKSQVAHGETVRETAAMISFLTEVIGIRDDMYPGEGHTYMKEVADAVSESYNEGVLAQRPTLVNLQCDLDHPTQSLSDLLK
ncbi:MAG: knotted carbamoyltransferase YgeW, partial [Candidatus Cloacimonadaceae bacterium]|nr:knotted carbamoyltransferase YgeW [Candidatus Cloacimonadaceae bacterium]